MMSSRQEFSIHFTVLRPLYCWYIGIYIFNPSLFAALVETALLVASIHPKEFDPSAKLLSEHKTKKAEWAFHAFAVDALCIVVLPQLLDSHTRRKKNYTPVWGILPVIFGKLVDVCENRLPLGWHGYGRSRRRCVADGKRGQMSILGKK